jgi:hypothetical protein
MGFGILPKLYWRCGGAGTHYSNCGNEDRSEDDRVLLLTIIAGLLTGVDVRILKTSLVLTWQTVFLPMALPSSPQGTIAAFGRLSHL